MSLNDSVIFNLLERITSADLNNLQSLDARTRGNVLQAMFFEQNVLAAGPLVLGGLNVTISGTNDLVISAGAISQPSGALTPAAGVLDSPYRIGFDLVGSTVNVPTPGADTWYVLEAQVVRILSSTQSRDIKNVGTGLYVPTNVPKQYQFEIQYQLVAGTAVQVPAVTGGDWIPLAVVFFDVPAGLSTVLPVARRWTGTVHPQTSVKGRFCVESHLSGSAAGFVRWQCLEPSYVKTSVGYWLGTSGGPSDIASATFKAPSIALVASTWYYLYVVPPQGMIPGNPTDGSGITVLSDQLPSTTSDGSRLNSGVIVMPAPWDVATIPALRATCIGAVLRNAANTGWVRLSYEHEPYYAIADVAEYPVLGALATDVGGAAFTNLTVSAPNSAKSFRLRIHMPQSSGVSSYGYVIRIRDTGGGGTTYAEKAGTVVQGVAYSNDVFIDVPRASTGVSFAVQVTNSLGNTNLPSSIQLVGFTW